MTGNMLDIKVKKEGKPTIYILLFAKKVKLPSVVSQKKPSTLGGEDHGVS